MFANQSKNAQSIDKTKDQNDQMIIEEMKLVFVGTSKSNESDHSNDPQSRQNNQRSTEIESNFDTHVKSITAVNRSINQSNFKVMIQSNQRINQIKRKR
jgi:hypothetical protein